MEPVEDPAPGARRILLTGATGYVGGRLLAHLHFRLAGLSGAVGALLERWGLKKRIKGWLRALR